MHCRCHSRHVCNMVMVIRVMVIIMRIIAMVMMGMAMMLLTEMVRPSHSIADIPSKHTAGSSTSCFTAIENQTKTSVHHLRQIIMMMVTIMMMRIMALLSPRTRPKPPPMARGKKLIFSHLINPLNVPENILVIDFSVRDLL